MSVAEPTKFSETDAALIGRAALRKASWRLIPLLALGYGIAYMDRINISFASLQMNQDLHFSATAYGLGAGLFFVAYVACEVPANLLLYRFGARRWLSLIMLMWGLLAMAMVFVRTPMEFYSMRFVLGAAEAGFFPGVIFYLSEWFPVRMRARVISRFYIAYPLASMVMGAVASPLLRLQGRLGLAGWQWLFLLEGLPGVLFSGVLFRYLVDKPKDAQWLSAEERSWLVREMANQPDDGGHGDSVASMLRDRRVWIVSATLFCVQTAGYAYQLSSPAILQGVTGLSVAGVGWLVSGAGLLGAVAMLVNAAHSDKTGERRWHVAGPFLLVGLMFLASGLLRIPWVVAGALTVVYVGLAGLQTPLLAISASFLQGKSMAAGAAIINMVSMTGGFLGPWAMGVAKDHTGDYRVGLVGLVVPCLVGAAVVLSMKVEKRARVTETVGMVAGS